MSVCLCVFARMLCVDCVRVCVVVCVLRLVYVYHVPRFHQIGFAPSCDEDLLDFPLRCWFASLRLSEGLLGALHNLSSPGSTLPTVEMVPVAQCAEGTSPSFEYTQLRFFDTYAVRLQRSTSVAVALQVFCTTFVSFLSAPDLSRWCCFLTFALAFVDMLRRQVRALSSLPRRGAVPAVRRRRAVKVPGHR